MTWKELLDNRWLIRIVLCLWLVSAVFIVFLLKQVDWIVHHDLYNFGLQFSSEWAVGYWALLRMIFVFLVFPMFLSGVYFALDIWFLIRERRGGVKPKPVEPVKPVSPVKRGVGAVDQNHMVVSCPKCKRVFSKPLVMLDFSTGKGRLVNVCPYCSFVLSWGEANETDVGVLDLNKKKVKE